MTLPAGWVGGPKIFTWCCESNDGMGAFFCFRGQSDLEVDEDGDAKSPLAPDLLVFYLFLLGYLRYVLLSFVSSFLLRFF